MKKILQKEETIMSEKTKAKVPTAEDLLNKYTLAEAANVISKMQDRERETLLCAIWKAYHSLCLVKGA